MAYGQNIVRLIGIKTHATQLEYLLGLSKWCVHIACRYVCTGKDIERVKMLSSYCTYDSEG